MNRLTRFSVASCTGLILAFTASPALAAHTDDSNGAHVEHRELVFPDGTYEYRQVTRHHGGYYNTTNARDQSTYQDGDSQSSYDGKTHYVELENVTKLSSQTTITQDGQTCRVNSLNVTVKGVTRHVKEEFCNAEEAALGG